MTTISNLQLASFPFPFLRYSLLKLLLFYFLLFFFRSFFFNFNLKFVSYLSHSFLELELREKGLEKKKENINKRRQEKWLEAEEKNERN